MDHETVVFAPGSIASLTGAARNTGADILASVPIDVREFPPIPGKDEKLTNLLLDGCIELGAFENCFGESVLFIKRSTFSSQQTGFEISGDLEAGRLEPPCEVSLVRRKV